MRWTLGVVGGLVLIGIVAAIVDNGTSSKTKTNNKVKVGINAEASSRPTTRVAAGATRSNPVPVHIIGGVWDGWRLRVLGVTRNAASFLGPDPQRIEAGGQVVMVSIAATYKAGGYAGLRALMRRLYVDGAHNVYYSPDSGDLNCAAIPSATHLVRPLNENSHKLVFSGHTTTGHLCFTVANNDARWLALYVDRPACNTLKTRDNCTKRVWFALR